MSDLNSMQTTINNLKEIVSKNQGADHETGVVLQQMEQLVQEIEIKTHQQKPQVADVVMPGIMPIQPTVSFPT